MAIDRGVWVLVVVTLAVGSASGSQRQGLQEGSARRPATDFSLTDATGANASLSGLRGKVVLLDFWATWCTGCKEEMPWFIEFQKKYRAAGPRVGGRRVRRRRVGKGSTVPTRPPGQLSDRRRRCGIRGESTASPDCRRHCSSIGAVALLKFTSARWRRNRLRHTFEVSFRRNRRPFAASRLRNARRCLREQARRRVSARYLQRQRPSGYRRRR